MAGAMRERSRTKSERQTCRERGGWWAWVGGTARAKVETIRKVFLKKSESFCKILISILRAASVI